MGSRDRGRQREGESREVEAVHEHVKKEGGGEWGERGKKARERGEASSPFYSKSGIPGCCQVTVGQSLEEMLTLRVSSPYPSLALSASPTPAESISSQLVHHPPFLPPSPSRFGGS